MEQKIIKHLDLLIERYPNLSVCKEDIEKHINCLRQFMPQRESYLFAVMVVLLLILNIL